MMRPTFDEVLEYLRAGEEDSKFEERLKQEPDGPSLLREAELMLTMLRGAAEPIDIEEDDQAMAASFENVVALESSMVAEGSLALKPRKDRSETGSTGRLDSEAMSISHLVRDAAGRANGLGVLTIRIKDGKVDASCQPSNLHEIRPKDKNSEETGKPSILHWPTINGEGISLQVMERPSDTRYLRFKLNSSNSWGFHRDPLRATELIFMPKKGPFVRISTNRKGFAALPMPEQSGILRIEADTPQHLTIELKK